MLRNEILKSSYCCLGIRDRVNISVLRLIVSQLEDLTNKIVQFFPPSFKYKYMIKKGSFLWIFSASKFDFERRGRILWWVVKMVALKSICFEWLLWNGRQLNFRSILWAVAGFFEVSPMLVWFRGQSDIWAKFIHTVWGFPSLTLYFLPFSPSDSRSCDCPELCPLVLQKNEADFYWHFSLPVRYNSGVLSG